MKDKYLRKLNIEIVDSEFENMIQQQVRTPEQVAEVFEKIKDKNQETLIALYLWEDLRATVHAVLGLGTPDTTLVDTETLFGLSFVLRSKYFVLIHNHPKGKSQPSLGDREAMEIVKAMGKTNRKEMLDFIIVADDGYWSMFEEETGGEAYN